MSDPAAELFARALAAYRQARPDAAMALCRQLLERQPAHFDALHLLGVLEGAAGRADAAIERLRAAVAVRPDDPMALRNLALAFQRAGRAAEAAERFRAATALDPASAEAWTGYGNALQAMGSVGEAIAAYRRAIAVNPALVNAHVNLAAALNRDGRASEALAACDAALALAPDKTEARMNKGHALRALNRFGEALQVFGAVAAAQPDRAEAHAAIGNIHATSRNYEAAIVSLERAVALAPRDVASLAMCLYARRRLCDWDRVETLTADLLERLASGSAAVPPMTLLALVDDPDAHGASARRVWAGVRSQQRAGVGPGPRRRLRVGYMSADFREHAMAHLVVPLLEHHDRSRFEVMAFAHGPDDRGAMRARLNRAVEAVIDVKDTTDAQFAAAVTGQGIDILVDLMGHTKGSRIEIMARRPAPVQVHYLGFPGPIGADFVDYALVDRYVVPPASEAAYVEKLVFLPSSFFIGARERAVAELQPRAANAPVVFNAVHSSYKITPAVFDVWIGLLRDVPASTLWLLGDSAAVERNLRREAAARGCAPDRLVFLPRLSHPEYLARLTLTDIFLDTHPYGAGATANDALWMGVPIVTLPGRSLASRMAASQLRALGLTELIAADLAEYRRVALALARDPAALAAIRRRLTASRATAPLFDAQAGMRHIEAAYAQMWQSHCRGEPPGSFAVAGSEL